MSGYYIEITGSAKSGYRVQTHGLYDDYSVSLFTSEYGHAKSEARKLAGEYGFHVHDNTT